MLNYCSVGGAPVPIFFFTGTGSKVPIPVVLKAWSVAGRNIAASVIFLRTDCVARNLYDQSILVDQPAQVTAARELWLAQGGRLPIPFCGSLAKTLLPGGTTQNPYAQTHSGIRAQRAHEHHQ